MEETGRLGSGGLSLKPSSPATDLRCFPFGEVGVRRGQGRCPAWELSYGGQEAGDACSFVLRHNMLTPSWSPRARNEAIICVLRVRKWKAEAQTEGQ